MSIRKALGAFKDQASIGLARVSSGAAAPDLDVAIVRATSHDDAPPDERHVLEVLRLAASSSRRACVASLARRLARTRDYVVAAKCLALLHRLLTAAADPRLLHELLRPAPSGRRAGEPPLALLLDFRDDAHAASWDHSAFVRAYALYLNDRVRFLVSLLPPPRFAEAEAEAYAYAAAGGGGAYAPAPAPAPVIISDDMDTDALLGRARQLRHLLDRVLACRPAGGARTSRVLLAALHPLVTESFQLYADVAAVLAALLDRFFRMDYPDCVRTFEAYVSAARQVDDLAAFYAWCDEAGVARSADFPDVQRIDERLLCTMEQFLRERGRAVRGSPPQPPPAGESAAAAAVHAQDDMNSVRALPAPERHHSGEPTRSVRPENTELVDLREPGAVTAADQENKLALALFSEAPGNADTSAWVAFPSEDDAPAPEVTSAWQTAAAEPGKADWELALVETASNLSRHKAILGGGMDTLLLGGMYEQGAVRRQVAAQAAYGSASSVAAPPPRQPVLMLPAPDGTVQTVGGDPFAASLAVPPPSYVQMADMERKQQLLLQEQQMWAQYQQGGMQGQPAGFRAAAVAMPMPMVPVAYNQVAGGYY